MPSGVAIDLRMVGPTPHGIARYGRAIWDGLPEDPRIRYVGLVAEASPLTPQRSGDRLVRCRAPFLSPLEQVEVPLILRREGVELLHATSFAVPAAWRGPLVLSLHDVNHLALPGWSGPGRTPYYHRVVAPAAARAARVLTGSAFSAREIERWLGLPATKVRVTPYAVDGSFAPSPVKELERIRARWRLPARFALYLGSDRPHKNAALAFELARRLAPRLPVVVAGGGLESHPSSPTQLLGKVDDADLPPLYSAASLFLFPSVYEGFGLPPLEAAACGTPVLVARGSSLDEIWQGVSPPLPPDQPGRWVATIEELLAAPERLQE
ncbi:MAG TPA: glycosyltransferase family 1 protein, partial [Myxococcales bacterium]|nr:glycosyltransferase family 1 protein [Myxococcales bacterium]